MNELSVDREAGTISGEGCEFGPINFTVNGILDKQNNVSFVCDLGTHMIHYKGHLSANNATIIGTFGLSPEKVNGKFVMKNTNWQNPNAPEFQELELDNEEDDVREVPNTSEWRQAFETVKGVIDSGEPYTDPDFPPEMCSLWNTVDLPQRKAKMASIKWKRASEMYKNPVIFDEIDPGDIKQGIIGNCYFLSTLSAMAEVPYRIRARFYTQKLNSAGIILVSLFVNGIETPFILDDYIPTKNGRSTCFSHSAGEELWVILLEKAFAKYQGSYARTEFGFMHDAASIMMGTQSHWLNNNASQKDKIWEKLFEIECRDWIAMASSKGQGEV